MTEGKKIAVHFADPELSDVCLVVGDMDFHVHKMILAVRSKYFKALFCSDFKEKNEKRIEIEADPMAFKRMLELIYNGHFSDTRFLKCNRNVRNDFWNAASSLWSVLDRFDCQHARDLLVKLIQTSICPQEMEPPAFGKRGQAYKCSGCADRFIFAAMHGLEFPECSPYGVTYWIRTNPNIPDELKDVAKLFTKISYT